MIEDLIGRHEGKTLEFKENTRPLGKIIQTIIAFANTAGGVIVIGIRDRNKEVVGVQNILKEEERIANAVADSVEPLLIPTIQLTTWRKRDLLTIHVPYSVGPYYLKSEGREKGTYIRFGSTNRSADRSTIHEITRLKQHLFFDELPCQNSKKGDLDFELGGKIFSKVSKIFNVQKAKSVGVLVLHQGHDVPTLGGILLFGDSDKREEIFPNAMIRCARFKGKTKVHFLDQHDINKPLPLALEDVLEFIKKHSTIGYEIEAVRRKEVFDFPPQVIREAVINSLVHADYSIKGSNIHVAIFDDRVEIINPGSLPFGLSLETAISGFSQLRNKVIGRVFRELGLIEQWGTGLGRMIQLCKDHGIQEPLFEEVDHYFKVTLFRGAQPVQISEQWEGAMMKYLNEHGEITPKKAQQIWGVTSRTTSTRLKKMSERGLIVEVSTGRYDPHKTFTKPRN